MNTTLTTASLVASFLLAGLQLPANALTASSLTKLDAPTRAIASAKTMTGTSQVIVRLNGAMTSAHRQALTSLGARLTNNLTIIHAVALTVPSRNLGRLAALPFVAHLSLDGQVRKSDEFTVEATGADTARSQYGLTGAGVTVAVIDSGISPHDDLSTITPVSGYMGPMPHVASYRVAASVSFVSSPNGNPLPPNGKLPRYYGQAEPFNGPDVQDQCGHGTHVAGIIGGNGFDSTSAFGYICYQTFTGIAPQVNLVNVKVLNNTGGGMVSDVVSGIQWVVNNAKPYNIRVINLSLGHPIGESYVTDPLCQAVEAAEQAGIVVVCAAGNNGRLSSTVNTPGLGNEGWGTAYGSIESPGNDPFVITVGAVKSGLQAAPQTSPPRPPARLRLPARNRPGQVAWPLSRTTTITRTT